MKSKKIIALAKGVWAFALICLCRNGGVIEK